MKKMFVLFLILFACNGFAQKPCEYSSSYTDSLGVYKATKDHLIHERSFANNSRYFFFSLINSNATPYLKLQTIYKSKEIVPVKCLDANSKIYFQLLNGKIVTLIHTDDENCGTLIRIEEEKLYSRINSGTYMFMKGAIEDLKSSPISIMRVKYGVDIEDFVLVKELQSTLTKETSYPENYFINYLNCIE